MAEAAAVAARERLGWSPPRHADAEAEEVSATN